MEFTIEERAKEYIKTRSKDNTIRIDIIEVENC